MFSTEQNLSSIKNLIVEFKEYIGMRYELAKLDIVSKFTVLIATLVLGVILMFLLGVALLFLSYSVAKSMANAIGNESIAFLIVSCIYIILALLAYRLRMRLFIRPIAKFLSELFLDPVNKKEDNNEPTETK